MSNSVHDYTVKDIKGKDVNLADYKGKVLLIVNTASKCGFTIQYKDLEKLYEQYKDKGFEILAFPSNDFMNQEPLQGDAIADFCEVNFGVSFKLFERVSVKGPDQIPLFKFLSNKSLNGKFNSVPKWNFHKYLVDKDGNVVDYYYSITSSTSAKVKKAIEKLI
jgi:glutathione peroxidase